MGGGEKGRKPPAMKIRLADLLIQKNMPAPVQNHRPDDVRALQQENDGLKARIRELEQQLEADGHREETAGSDSKAVTALHSRGVALLKQGHHVKAAGCFLAVLALDSDHMRAKINLAVAYAQLDNTGEAIGLLRAVLDQHPDSEIARQNLAYLTSSGHLTPGKK